MLKQPLKQMLEATLSLRLSGIGKRVLAAELVNGLPALIDVVEDPAPDFNEGDDSFCFPIHPGSQTGTSFLMEDCVNASPRIDQFIFLNDLCHSATIRSERVAANKKPLSLVLSFPRSLALVTGETLASRLRGKQRAVFGPSLLP